MRKAQTEIFGLMVIVMLLIVVGLFYMSFSSTKPKDVGKEIRDRIKASNFLNAVMRSTPCRTKIPPEPMESVIKNCIMDGRDYCGNPCKTYIRRTVSSIVDTYYGNISYSFEVEQGGTVFLKEGQCLGEDVMLDKYPMVAGAKSVTVWFKHCK